jgi:hypothetical protein
VGACCVVGGVQPVRVVPTVEWLRRRGASVGETGHEVTAAAGHRPAG